MSQETHFVPPLAVADADDGRTIWLALTGFEQKMWSEVTSYRADGNEGMARAAEREAARAARLKEIAYVEYRNALTRATTTPASSLNPGMEG